MKIIFLCAINNIGVDNNKYTYNVKVVSDESNSEKPFIRITNNRVYIEKYLTQKFKEQIGELEFNHLSTTAPLIAYSEHEVEDITPEEYLEKLLSLLKIYLYSLWTIKDNAGDFDLGFVRYNKQGIDFASSNYFTNSFCNCNCSTDIVNFTREELVAATQIFKAPFSPQSCQVANSLQYGRIAIANYFIQHARSCFDYGLKIVGYCSALEALFSNDSSELTHKLGERMSKYLYADINDRAECYKTIKKIYSFRSKVVHGDRMKDDKVNEIKIMMPKIDNICRIIINKCMRQDENIFELSPNDLEEYFLKMLME